MRNKFLTLVLVICVSMGFLVFIYNANSYYTAYRSQTDSTEALLNYFQLMEMENKKAMEDYVTTTPEIYTRQLIEKIKETNENPTSNSVKTSDNSELNLRSSESTVLYNQKNKTDLVNIICPDYMFSQKRYLKEIVQVWQKGEQARISVILGSRVAEAGYWGDIPTSFYLHKEEDGNWKIFMMQTMVVNERYAQ